MSGVLEFGTIASQHARDQRATGRRHARSPRGKACIGLFYALAVAAWSLGGWLSGMSAPYAAGMLIIAAHLAWQTRAIDLARPEVNYRLFLANILTGMLLAGAAFMGTW